MKENGKVDFVFAFNQAAYGNATERDNAFVGLAESIELISDLAEEVAIEEILGIRLDQGPPLENYQDLLLTTCKPAGEVEYYEFDDQLSRP